jgi:four helix bundle protein
MEDILPFERMDVYRVANELLDLVNALKIPPGNAEIRDQLRRAAASVVLNCAEACGKDGADRKRFFTIARGSALESAAALRVLLSCGALTDEEHGAGREYCVRLYAMLTRLSGRGRPRPDEP